MKANLNLLTVFSILLLTSCGIGSGNFKNQKFTNLKSLRSLNASSTETSSCSFMQTSPSLLELDSPSNEDKDLEDDDPKVTKIKNAIAEGKTIILHQKNKKFSLKSAVYDSFNSSLFGELEEIDANVKEDNALVFQIPDNAKVSNSKGLSINDLSEVTLDVEETEEVLSEEDDEYYIPNNKLRKTWPEVTKAEVKASENAKKTKRFLGLSLIGIVGVIGGLFLVFALGSGWPIAIALAFGAFYIIMAILVRINIRKYRKECDEKKKRMRPGMRLLNFFYGRSFFPE